MSRAQFVEIYHNNYNTELYSNTFLQIKFLNSKKSVESALNYRNVIDITTVTNTIRHIKKNQNLKRPYSAHDNHVDISRLFQFDPSPVWA